jgi:hypothetical protein
VDPSESASDADLQQITVTAQKTGMGFGPEVAGAAAGAAAGSNGRWTAFYQICEVDGSGCSPEAEGLSAPEADVPGSMLDDPGRLLGGIGSASSFRAIDPWMAVASSGIIVSGTVMLGGAPAAADAGTDTILVIGRLRDTAIAKSWVGHSIIDIADWTIEKNAALIQKAIDARQKVYLASPIAGNTWNAVAGRATVYGTEIAQFLKAGYQQVGDYLIPPGVP